MRAKLRSHFSRVILLIAIAGLAPLLQGFTANGGQQQRQQAKQYQTPPQLPVDQVGPSIVVSPSEDYRVGPSDVISIHIEDAPELSQIFRVAADGSIEMPFLGRINVQKKNTSEVTRLIADRLRGEYLQDPQVTVLVLQINSRSYFIQGAVRRPGIYQVEGQPSLLKLVTVAGGLSEDFGSTAFVIRELKANADEQTDRDVDAAAGTTANIPSASNSQSSAPDGDASQKPRYELLKVNINGLLRGNFDQDIALQPGDIIHIPPTDVFFVAGEVNSPGSFVLKAGTTLRQAISLAQGTSFNASGDRGIIFREDPATGKRNEIKVNIAAVMNGKKDDIPILANDIIIVPNSRMKTVGGTLLRAFGVNSARIPMRYGY